MKTKILLSTVTALTLLLTGCTDEQKAAVEASLNQSETIADSTENTNEDTTPDTDNETETPVVNNKPGGWYGKTVVSATAVDGTVYTHSTAGIFGELVDSTEEKDAHDIPGYGASILQVVFPQSEWEDDNGDYFSNYQSFSEDGSDKKTWTFQIKNQQTVDLSNAAISIELPAIKNVTYNEVNGKIVYNKEEVTDTTKASQLTLLDIDNETAYTVAQLATANLTMDGLHTRTFKWVLGSVDSSDYQKTQETTSKSASFAKTATLSTLSEDEPRLGGKFGLPPQ